MTTPNPTPEIKPQGKKDCSWLQFSLASLLLGQLIAGGILFLNMTLRGYVSWGSRYFGWPFKSFREYLYGGTYIELNWDALNANILVWLTLVLSPWFGSALFNKFRQGNQRWPPVFCRATRIVFAAVLILLILTTLITIQHDTYHGYLMGWPYHLAWVTSYHIEIYQWRYLILNIYAWLACLAIPCWICERTVGRRMDR